VGGSATPRALMEAYDAKGITILQIWGMTETTPIACTSRPRRHHKGLTAEQLLDVRVRTGTIVPGLEARIVGDDGTELPWDGRSVGELQCRGPWVAAEYWGGAPEKFQEGWLRTGDVARMEPDGTFTIVDRSKDLVKSGGEWISSVELEAACLAHPAVREAAVVGVRSRKWDERPVVVASLHAPVVLDELRSFLTGTVATWWLPDDLVVVDDVAKTSVGKYDKKALRALLADRVLP
jgi:fatty-acyl-CoA synthase